MNLESERMILRELAEADWMDVHKYASLANVCQYQPWGPNTENETKEFVKQVLVDSKQSPRSRFVFAITLKGNKEVIGAIEFNVRDCSNKSGEIGYIIHPDYWGKGIATEAANEIISFGFSELKLHRIYATCDVRNIGSAKVLEKMGLKLEGKMREDMLLRDGWRDTYLYSILEHEWNQN